MITLDKIQEWLKTIGTGTVGAPQWNEQKKVFEYSEVSVEVVSFLKAVRAVQSLHSIRHLQAKGLIIDFYSIGRCIFDCCTEIDFLLESFPQCSSTVEQFIKNFREATIDEFLDQATDPVLTKKIRNASARVRAAEGHITFDQAKGHLDKIYKTLSGYVHSQYSHIVEIYGGPSDNHSFQVQGIPSESKKAEYYPWIKELDDMVIFRLALMAKQFNCHQVLQDILKKII